MKDLAHIYVNDFNPTAMKESLEQRGSVPENSSYDGEQRKAGACLDSIPSNA